MGHSRYWPSISHDWSLNTPISHGCRLDWRVWLDGDELSRQERHLAAVAEKVRSRYAYSLTEWFPHYIRHRCWVGRGGHTARRTAYKPSPPLVPFTLTHMLAPAQAEREAEQAERLLKHLAQPHAHAHAARLARYLHTHDERVLSAADSAFLQKRLRGSSTPATAHAPEPEDSAVAELTPLTTHRDRSSLCC